MALIRYIGMFERQIDVVIGLQMGDEGKGRFVHFMAPEYFAVIRYNGGSNAGHTFMEGGVEINTHQIPSGIVYDGLMNIISQGCLVNPEALYIESGELAEAGIHTTPNNLMVSREAHLVLPHHVILDELRENGNGGQGSTKSGISFAAADKYGRRSPTVGDLEADPEGVYAFVRDEMNTVYRQAHLIDGGDQLQAYPESYMQAWRDSARWMVELFAGNDYQFIGDALQRGNRLLAEGAQSSGLDIEQGVRPQGTSSHVTVAGVLASMGVGPQAIGEVYGVAKLPKSRVGGTPESVPTIITDQEMATRIRGKEGDVDSEFGKSTGRPRMMAWLDLPELRRAVRVNGVTQLMLTKLDCVPRAGEITRVAYLYEGPDGELIKDMPNSVRELRGLTPLYRDFNTWSEDISGVRFYDDLPQNAKTYIDYIHDSLGVSITQIGVGPEADQVVTM